MNKKIVFIIPPSRALNLKFVSYQQPTNMAYLAAMVIQAGYEAEIWDYGLEGFSEGNFVHKIRSFEPMMIGLHCKTFNIKQGHELAGIIKKYFPDIIVVIGGPHSSALPEETLKQFPEIDIVAIGEGEETIVKLCDAISQGKPVNDVKGIAFTREGKVVLTEPRELIAELDTLPYPARYLYSKDLYTKGHATRGISSGNNNVTEVFTSRGCPGKCIFCAVNVCFGNRVRFRSADNVLGEVEECLRKFHYDHIIFQDDTFTLRKTRLRELLNGFRMLGLRSWSCDARVDTVDEETLREMSSTGCKKISFGVESGSEKILHLNKKNITIQQVKNAVAWAREAGIDIVETNFIIGSHPDETEEDVQKSRTLISELRPDILSVSVIVPLPGTEVRRLMKERGYLEGEDWDHFQMIGAPFQWRTKYFTSSKLAEIQQDIINSYYFTPQYCLSRLRKIKTMKDLLYWIKVGIGYISYLTRKRVSR